MNFKPLNKITVKHHVLMPRIDEVLDGLQGSAVYSTLGVTDAFLQVPIHRDDRHIMAFHTRTRKLEFTCTPRLAHCGIHDVGTQEGGVT